MSKFAPNQYPVRLTVEQRERLADLTRNGHAPAKKIRHAPILLLADRDRPDGPWTDPQIADALAMHVNTVARLRKRFVTRGEQPALERQARQNPPVPPKMDGVLEAHLVALCCSPPPEGQVRWTMQLLAGELTRRGLVTQISAETVRKTLKRNELQPWRKESWCIPEKDAARFVAQMEQVLDVYTAAPDPEVPTITMDEASKQLLSHEQEPLP